MTIGETDELLTLKHNMEITPLRAFDPMPTLPEISANGVIFSTENEFEASGEAMIIQDREGNYFLRFENFSLPSLLDLQILFANNPEGQDATFFQNLSAHRGELNMALPSDFDPHENPFLLIIIPSINRIIAIAELL